VPGHTTNVVYGQLSPRVDEPLAELDNLRVGECSLLHHAAPTTVPTGKVSEDTPVRPLGLGTGFVERIEEVYWRFGLGAVGFVGEAIC